MYLIVNRNILKNFDNSGKVETMQDTKITENKPLIVIDDSDTIEKKLVTVVIVVNLIVLVSIFLCA